MKKRVLLTQSQGRLEGLSELLNNQGIDVVHQPLIQTTVIHSEEILKQAKALLTCEWMLFTSQAAIEGWLELNLTFPKHIKYGAVGQKTAKRLEALDIEVSLTGKSQDADGLADVFIRKYPDAKSVALPKGDLSLSILDDRLKAAGIKTKPLVIYKTQTVDTNHLNSVLFNEVFDVVFFASPSAVDAYQFLEEETDTDVAYVAIGETTAKTIQKTGRSCGIAQTPTIEVIAEAIVKAISEGY